MLQRIDMFICDCNNNNQKLHPHTKPAAFVDDLFRDWEPFSYELNPLLGSKCLKLVRACDLQKVSDHRRRIC